MKLYFYDFKRINKIHSNLQIFKILNLSLMPTIIKKINNHNNKNNNSLNLK